MKSMRFLLLCACALQLAGCGDDDGPTEPSIPPLAFTRFVSVLPDTSAMDWRFVDQIEFAPFALGQTFRGFTPYQGAEAGERHLKIFPTSTEIELTSQAVVDTMLDLTPETYYTIFQTGFARSGGTPAAQLLVITDDIPTPAAGTIALRVVHLGAGLGSVDVYAGTSTTLPATPLFTDLTYGETTTYVSMPTGALTLTAVPTGTTASPFLAQRSAPAGLPAVPNDNLTAVGGSTIGGSVITAVLVPRSVSGSAAPQTPTSGASRVTAPNWIYLIDRHPR